jgi:site-specific recombinase XerD
MRIEHVSKFLGHTNIMETQVYAKIVDKDLDEAIKIFN